MIASNDIWILIIGIINHKITALVRLVGLKIPLLGGDVTELVSFQVIVTIVWNVASGSTTQDLAEGDVQEDAQIEIGIDRRAKEQDTFYQNDGVTTDGVVANGGRRIGIQVNERECFVEGFTVANWGQQFSLQEGQIESVIDVTAHRVISLAADSARVVEIVPVDEGNIAALRLQESRKVLGKARLAGGIDAVDADNLGAWQRMFVQLVRNE